MKTCALLVSVPIFETPPKGKTAPPSGSLCAGHPLIVSEENTDGYVKCGTSTGAEVWIAENYVAHAREGGRP
jgi:hypothetical protein